MSYPQKTGKINSVAPGSTRPTATRPTVHGRYLSTPPPYLGALPCAPYCSKYQNSNLTLFSPHIAPAALQPSPTTSCGWGAGRGVGAGGRVRAGGWIPGVRQWTDAMSAWGFTAGVRKLGARRGGVSGAAEREVAGSGGGGIGGQAGHSQVLTFLWDAASTPGRQVRALLWFAPRAS